MRRLNEATLALLPASVRRPQYDRTALAVGMAHIGVGAFHRCHQAEFADDMLEARFGPWGVAGVNLRPPRLADSLGAQDHLYSRTLREGDSAQTRVIGCLKRCIDVETPQSAECAIATLADPAIGVVTMTLTEKGYCHLPSTGRIDWTNPDVEADLAGARIPRSALGLLAAALERRRRADDGLTLISCDNIPANGAILRSVLLDFAAARAPALARWIEAQVAFPCTMVDRIVPATAPGDLDIIAGVLGVRDHGAVVGEPFRQWAIEDSFAGPRPPWDLAGAQFVADVAPHEQAKMRILNAAQSTLSHLGALCGRGFSFEAAADPVLGAMVRRMLTRESGATLGWGAADVERYIDTALRRIGNSAIRHRCHQIGTDGSQKIVQRLLRPLRELRAAGRPAPLLCLALAAWMAYVLAASARFGRRYDVSDPHAAAIVALADGQALDFAALARAVLGIDAVFDPGDAGLAAALGRHLEALLAADPRAHVLAALNGDTNMGDT